MFEARRLGWFDRRVRVVERLGAFVMYIGSGHTLFGYNEVYGMGLGGRVFAVFDIPSIESCLVGN